MATAAEKKPILGGFVPIGNPSDYEPSESSDEAPRLTTRERCGYRMLTTLSFLSSFGAIGFNIMDIEEADYSIRKWDTYALISNLGSGTIALGAYLVCGRKLPGRECTKAVCFLYSVVVVTQIAAVVLDAIDLAAKTDQQTVSLSWAAVATNGASNVFSLIGYCIF